MAWNLLNEQTGSLSAPSTGKLDVRSEVRFLRLRDDQNREIALKGQWLGRISISVTAGSRDRLRSSRTVTGRNYAKLQVGEDS